MKRYLLLIITIMLIFTSCDKESIKETEKSETELSVMEIIEESGMKNVFGTTYEKSFVYKYYFSNYYFSKFNRSFIMDDKIYLITREFKGDEDNRVYDKIDRRSEYDDLYLFDTFIISYDLNGENEEITKVEQINPYELSDIYLFWLDSEYNHIFIEEYKHDYILYKRTSDGEVVFSMLLDDIFGEDILISMTIGEDDNIYIGTSKMVLALDKNGEILYNVEVKDYALCEISSTHGKRPIYKLDIGNYNCSYHYYNMETEKFDPIEMTGYTDFMNGFYGHIIYGEGFDYYYYTIYGIYGYDIAGNTLTKVLDWMNSDITHSEMITFTPISHDKMMMLHTNSSNYQVYIKILEAIPEDRLPEKQYFTIGYISQNLPNYLSRAVSEFNKNNDFYRITLTNYYNPADIDNYMQRFNNAVASSDTPDLLYIDRSIPVLQYSKKGIFVDLNGYLDEYPELRNNLLPFVKNNTDINGELTHIITKFHTYTLISKTKNVDDIDNLTFTDMLNMYNNGENLGYPVTRPILEFYSIDKIIADSVDYTNGTCDFNHQGFKDFAELMKLLPESNETLPQHEMYEQYRKDEMVFNSTYVSELKGYFDNMINNFRDEDAIVTGFPTMNGDVRGDFVVPYGFAVMDSSDMKEMAWEFIMYCLSDHFAEYSLSIGGLLPTYTGIDVCNRLYNNMRVRYPDDFEQSGEEFIDGANGIEIVIDGEEIDIFNEYIYNVDNCVYYDSDIRKIISEELSEFYVTTKSTDDLIKIIQSRVSIYMSEMWS